MRAGSPCLAVRRGARDALQQSPILRADGIILNHYRVVRQYQLQTVLPMSPVSSVTYVPERSGGCFPGALPLAVLDQAFSLALCGRFV
jgi:hypothetical protein